MRQPYTDITDEMTRLLRCHHSYQGDPTTGAVLTERCPGPGTCLCVATPLWWDEHGVPRFRPHNPLLCPVIGATEVILLQIACQNCSKEFPVQMSWDRERGLRALAFRKAGAAKSAAEVRNLVDGAADLLRDLPTTSLAYQIAGRGPHYGDPPYHDGCRSGNTMNVWDLRVLEFWRRGESSMEYVRIPELEVPLPDLTDTDRVGPS